MELAHYHKETLIVSLNDQMDKMTVELQQLDGKLYNCSLEIEELREEVANCNEVIEKYREKHGDLKGVKNKAIEMEIKDCLRWIELQNRDFDMSEMAETTPSEQGEQGEITPSDTTPSDQGEDHSLSSVIRGIEIEKVPKEEMGVIRD